MMVEAAQTASRTHPFWQAEFQRVERRIGEKKAIVALARKLLVVVWHVLHGQSADQRADAERVAFKLMVWSWKLTDEQRGGLTSRQFIRIHLVRLGLGYELTHITRGGTKRPLASVEECWSCGRSCADHQQRDQATRSPARCRRRPVFPAGQDLRKRALGQRKEALRTPIRMAPVRS